MCCVVWRVVLVFCAVCGVGVLFCLFLLFCLFRLCHVMCGDVCVVMLWFAVMLSVL